MKPHEQKVPKRSYRKPELRVYGNIRQITQAVGDHGAKDGGPVKGHKRTGV